MYRIGTLAKLTGVSPNLLRAWERRYDFLVPIRQKGRQRYFDSDDRDIVLYLKEQIASGLRVGELAQEGRQVLLVKAKEAKVRDQESFGPVAPSVHEKSVSLIVEAARCVDASSMHLALNEALAISSPEDVINRVIIPAMVQIGNAWKAGKMGTAGEHLASAICEQKILTLIHAAQPRVPRASSTQRKALCCCFSGEQHRIGILSVSYLLASAGFFVIFLGANLPFEDLATALESVKPSSVWLSVTRSSVLRKYETELAGLVKKHNKVKFIVGGQGVRSCREHLARSGCRVFSEDEVSFEKVLQMIS